LGNESRNSFVVVIFLARRQYRTGSRTADSNGLERVATYALNTRLQGREGKSYSQRRHASVTVEQMLTKQCDVNNPLLVELRNLRCMGALRKNVHVTT
jgi:hypothetical protein